MSASTAAVTGAIAWPSSCAPLSPSEALDKLQDHDRERIDSVATEQLQIQEVNDYYISRQGRLTEGCAAVGIECENSHASLWDWFHYWNTQGMDTYAERRNYVRRRFNGPVLSAVGRVHNPSPVAEREPTGWERVDRSLGKANAQFNTASTKEEWQTVCLLGCEILISLGQAVYDPDVYGDTDLDGSTLGIAGQQRAGWPRCASRQHLRR
jgi:hypothetical protein